MPVRERTAQRVLDALFPAEAAPAKARAAVVGLLVAAGASPEALTTS